MHVVLGVAKKRRRERQPDYSVKHRLSSRPVEYTVVERMDESEFLVGSEVIALDVPIGVQVQQRGFFPLLSALIPWETELEVLITRDLEVADRWVREREKGQVEWVGYAIHERPMDLKRGAQLAFIPRPATFEGAIFQMKLHSTSFCFAGEGNGDSTEREEHDSLQQEGMAMTKEALDVHLGLRLDELDEVEFRKNSLYDIEGSSSSESPFPNGLTDQLQQRFSDVYDRESDSDYSGFESNAETEAEADPLGNEGFDFYPEVEDDVEAELDRSQKHQTPRKSVIYKVGNIIIEDKNPPQPMNRAPPLLPPKVFTRNASLASVWESDGDRAETQPLPADAVPIRKNVISLLTVCHGRHILVLQLRRMNGIGSAVFDLLYSKTTKKLSFDHKDNTLLLAPLGIKVNEGTGLKQLLASASERQSFEELQPAVQTLNDHQLAKILTGIDISDREFYVEDWNHPLLCERVVACLAKEAFALHAMGVALSRANRTHFFDIDVFVQNPIPSSFLDRAALLPATTVHHLTLNRGRFYEDMGKLLEGLSFDITITVTRSTQTALLEPAAILSDRDPDVAETWAEQRFLDESIQVVGYNQEWVMGRIGEITAIFTVATETEVLICQQLYMPWIPSELRNILLWRDVRKYGPSSYLSVFKKNQRPLLLRGFESLPKLLLDLTRITKFKNLPKALRDLNFKQIVKLLVAPENETQQNMRDGVRWDKPAFSEEEIEYQALRAWLGWAVIHILSRSTPHHLERFVAYLEGSNYVPKRGRVPDRIRKRFSDADDNGDEDQPSEGSSKERWRLLDRLTSQSGEITHSDLNRLFDVMFKKTHHAN